MTSSNIIFNMFNSENTEHLHITCFKHHQHISALKCRSLFIFRWLFFLISTNKLQMYGYSLRLRRRTKTSTKYEYQLVNNIRAYNTCYLNSFRFIEIWYYWLMDNTCWLFIFGIGCIYNTLYFTSLIRCILYD